MATGFQIPSPGFPLAGIVCEFCGDVLPGNKRFCSRDCYFRAYDSHLSHNPSAEYDRFLNYVIPEPMSGCWLWIGSVDGYGYGQFTCSTRKRSMKAHRWSYFREHGIKSSELMVLHTCDNPPCVNPHHLFLGTRNDNVQDNLRKNRNHWKNQATCIRGHQFNTENTRLQIRSDGKIWRSCKECRRLRHLPTAG